jgi:glycosyltransferase involved in cell wall biosynthesis
MGVPLRGVVIPLGVDGAQVIENRKQANKVLPKEQKIVLFLSRLDPKKNIEGLLRAFAAVRRQRANALLVIAGDGPADYILALKNLAQAEGVAQAVTWVGHLDGERKWDTLTSADVFILPSFSENFGIAAVEALTAGLPCVLGSGVAIADSIAAAGAGLVTEPDASSIAEALNRLLGDEELLRNMGTRGRELAEREYSSSVMANRLLELYSSVARSGSRSTRDSFAALNEQRRQANRSK